MWRYTTIPPNLSLVNSNISSIAQLSATTASQLAALIGQQNADSSGGTTVNENFTTYTSNTLPAQWTVQSGAVNFGIYIPTGSTFDHNNGLNTNIAWFYLAPADNKRYYARHNTVLKTDSVSVQVVLGSNGRNSQCTTIISHASSTLDNFVYVNVFSDHLYIGYGTFSAGVYTFHDWDNVGITVTNGQLLELRNVGTTWTVLLNGAVVLSHTDSGGNAFYDASHRYWGYAIAFGTALLGNDISFGLQSITVSDIAIPTYLGTGFRMYRASTSNAALPGSGNQRLASGTLDTTEYLANMTAIDTAGLGGVQVTRSGLYTLTARIAVSSGAGTAFSFRALIWSKNAVVGDAFVLRRVGMDTSANAFSAGVTATVYLTVGNIVYPGFNQAGSNNVVGDAAGTITYWEGSLSNA